MSDEPRPRIPRALSAVVVLMAVGLVVALLLNGNGDGGKDGQATTSSTSTPSAGEPFPAGEAPKRATKDLEAAVKKADCKLALLPSEGDGEVVEPVQYLSDPPHSGRHFAEPAPDGAYREVVATEAAVHSLRHGRVVVWYQPSLPPATLGALKALYDESPRHLLLVPRPDMTVPLAATAWTRRLRCPGVSPRAFDAVRAFRDRFRDRGPEYVP